MRVGEKGVTLLESVLAMVLGAIFLQLLLHGSMVIYGEMKDFNQMVHLQNEARWVKDFISSQIRQSEDVEIFYKESLTPITPNESPKTQINIVEGTFQTIKLDQGNKEINLLQQDKEKHLDEESKALGRHRLVYVGGKLKGNVTQNLISNQIESIKVTRHADANHVVFTCLFCKKEEKDPALKTEISFCVPLEYKLKPKTIY